MPAEISFVNGRAEAFTSLSPAWWDNEGEYNVDRHLTSEEVWGERGLLNFRYSLQPIYDESGNVIPGFKRTVREDTKDTIGCGLSDRYRIIQPRDALGWMDSLMMDGVMKYASAGVLKGGRSIWILGVIPDAEVTPIAGERHEKFICWTDRFDGGGTLKWFPCVTRIECMNTLRMALGERDREKFPTIRHTGNVNGKLQDARRAILAAKKAFEQYNRDCLTLISKTYTTASCRDYIAQLFPAPLDPTTGKELEKGRQRIAWERKVQQVRQAFRDPSNNREEMKGTWYQLFNSVTLAVDHGDIFRSRSVTNPRAGVDNRFLNLMEGPGAQLKEQAFQLAYQFAVAS
jgi:phage/plasmid-like protein (TIGR03299 family)